MLRKTLETSAFVALILVAWVWVIGWASNAFGQSNNTNTWQTPGNQTVGGFVQLGVNSAGQAVASGAVQGSAGYPAGATAVANTAVGTTLGATATLPAAAGKFTYLCGLSVSPGSATAAITTELLTVGLLSNMEWWVGAPITAAGTTGVTLTVAFYPCIPSNSINTAISLSDSALGTGGINQVVQIWGYQL